MGGKVEEKIPSFHSLGSEFQEELLEIYRNSGKIRAAYTKTDNFFRRLVPIGREAVDEAEQAEQQAHRNGGDRRR